MTAATISAGGEARRYRVSFDVGGTFTDFTLLGEHDGRLHFHKVPSTPDDPSRAIGTGIADLIRDHAIPPETIGHVGHGTTVATNMIIERRGTPTAFLVTRGFRDIMEIGRQTRPHLYDYNQLRPAPLVPRQLVFEIPERITAHGEVVEALDEAALRDAATRIRDAGIRSVAICFLHSYRFPAHEQRAQAVLREVLGEEAYISASSEVLPEFREFERASTTIINAYVGPRMSAYMTNLVASINAMGVTPSPNTVHSNGGLMSVQAVCATPVKTCVSGPAAGVIGAAALGRVAGFSDLITFDVGGTSTDVSLIRGSLPLFASSRLVADYPVRSQMVDVHVIGAGGGSIAAIDVAGALKVGPRSAGAVPGPVAYGRGGTVVTVTDAHVCLGRLNPVSLLQGRMKIYAAEAREAVQLQIAEPLGLSVEEAALGILRIANSNMARAVRHVSTERGHDIRDFALCGFGGAGGLHAAELAGDCGIRTILIPQEPGTMCARGILLSNISMDFVTALLTVLTPESWDKVSATLAELRVQADRWLAAEKIPAADRRFSARLDARYQGQNFEIPVDVELDALCTPRAFAVLVAEAHRQEYGYDAEGRDIEIVNCRVQATGLVPRPKLAAIAGGSSLEGAVAGHRQVYFAGGGWHDTPVYDRAALPVEREFAGPAIVEEMSSTTVITPGQTAVIDQFGNLIIKA
jgi:N-methylhydantoinase A